MFAVLSKTRKATAWLVAGLSMIWLAACDPVTTGDRTPTRPSETVTVALLVPHGAESTQEQRLARDLERAARLAVSDLQGVQLDLRVYGTAGNAARAQEAARAAVADGARIIIGPLHADSANAVSLAVADQNINVLAFSNNSTIAGDNLFILGQTFETTAQRLFSYAKSQGKDRIVTVNSDNLAGRLGRTAIENAVVGGGGVNAGNVSYQFSQDGVVAAVPRIKQAVDRGNADAVFLTSTAAGALPLFAQMLPEQGMGPDVTQYIGLARWDVPRQTLELPGLQGGWFALPDPARTAQFRNRFEAKHEERPHELASLAYDGIAATGALVRRGGRNALGREALTQPAGFQGVNGVFRFLPDGTNERGLAIATVRDQRVVVIENAPGAFGGAGF